MSYEKYHRNKTTQSMIIRADVHNMMNTVVGLLIKTMTSYKVVYGIHEQEDSDQPVYLHSLIRAFSVFTNHA